MSKNSFADKIKNIFQRRKKKNGTDDSHLLAQEREMIRGVRDLDETDVREIMVPRVDVIRISVTSTMKECIEQVTSSGHSRIPVYKDTVDRIVGILYAKDLLKYTNSRSKFDLKKVIREPFYVPQSMNAAELLREFLKKRIHLAVVVDEYGGVAGIITLEDIIEEIVGEIHDEYDNEEKRIEVISDKEFLLNAKLNIGEINDLLGTDFPDEDFDTLSGFILDIVGGIPGKGTEVEWNNYTFTIEKKIRNHITLIKMNSPRSLQLREVGEDTKD